MIKIDSIMKWKLTTNRTYLLNVRSKETLVRDLMRFICAEIRTILPYFDRLEWPFIFDYFEKS